MGVNGASSSSEDITFVCHGQPFAEGLRPLCMGRGSVSRKRSCQDDYTIFQARGDEYAMPTHLLRASRG